MSQPLAQVCTYPDSSAHRAYVPPQPHRLLEAELEAHPYADGAVFWSRSSLLCVQSCAVLPFWRFGWSSQGLHAEAKRRVRLQAGTRCRGLQPLKYGGTVGFFGYRLNSYKFILQLSSSCFGRVSLLLLFQDGWPYILTITLLQQQACCCGCSPHLCVSWESQSHRINKVGKDR